jgi:TPR repeat protein
MTADAARPASRSTAKAAAAFTRSKLQAEAQEVLEVGIRQAANATPEQREAFQIIVDANACLIEAQRLAKKQRPEDIATITELLREAAEAGYAMGQYMYGNWILRENVPGKSLHDAICWLRLAAEQNPNDLVFPGFKNLGVADAAERLGSLYLRGHGGAQPADYAAAAKWYTKAADAGSASAQNGGLHAGSTQCFNMCSASSAPQ